MHRQALEVRCASIPIDRCLFVMDVAVSLKTRFAQLGGREDVGEECRFVPPIGTRAATWCPI